MRKGFELITEKGFLTNNIILKIQEELEGNTAGFRKLPLFISSGWDRKKSQFENNDSKQHCYSRFKLIKIRIDLYKGTNQKPDDFS